MPLLSFRVDKSDAESVRAWSEHLGIDRSSLLRDALRLHLVRLSGERDADAWVLTPATDDERAFDAVADWGPAEDWSDWDDAAR